MDQPKILFYDIETTLLQAYLFSTGKQFVGHKCLIPGKSMWGIVCITYCWNDGGDVQIIKWTPEGGLSAMIAEFDVLVRQADHSIGKNSDKFDVKMINACRMMSGLPGIPEWSKYTDDLEKQMRRYFRLPSQSLDYISGQLGFGGKVKMEFGDWVAIDNYMDIKTLQLTISDITILDTVCKQRYNSNCADILDIGQIAFDKMCFYGMKDTRDTRALWDTLKQHFEPKFNMANYYNEKIACRNCASSDLRPNGTRLSGKFKWQQYLCNSCNCYAGRTPFSTTTEREGKIG